MSKVYQADEGTAIIADMQEDVTGASLLRLDVIKPSGATAQWTGAAYQTNKIRYVTVTDDLDEAGTYLINPYGEWATPWKGHGDTIELIVYALGG